MDEDLKAYLVGMEIRLLDNVTEQIRGSETRMEGRILESETRMESRVLESETRMEGRVLEQIRDSETKLLTEFWKWGRVSDQRIRRVEHSDATTVERLAAMEDRLFKLERKVAGSKE